MSCLLFVEDQESTGKINIDDLYEKKKNRDLKQLSIFNKLLNRIHKRITVTARSKVNDRHVWFVVPEFIFGEPCYDNADCVAYLVSQLKNNGFSIRYIHPNTLFISWEHHVPTYVRDQIRKKTGVVVDNKGVVVARGDTGGASGGGGGADAADGAGVGVKDDNNTRLLGGGEGGGKKHVFNAIRSYKPTGVYDVDCFDKIGKRVS